MSCNLVIIVFIFTIYCTLQASARHLAGTWPPDIQPRLDVGWRGVGSLPASSSPSTALCWPPPGIRPRLSLWLGRLIPLSRRSPTAVLPLLPTPFSFYSPPHSLSPILYLPSPIRAPPTPCPLSGTHPQPAHTHAPLVPSAEETKHCSTVVSTNAI